MFRYLLKLGLILLPLLIIIILLELHLSKFPNSYNLKKHYLEKKLNEIQVLIMGNSQPHQGINPKYLDQPAFNLADNSQDLYYDYLLLEKYLPYLPHLKTVIIPLSYFSLETKMIDSDEYWRKYFYYYYFAMPYEGFSWFNLKNYSLTAIYTPKKVREFFYHGFRPDSLAEIDGNGWFIPSDKMTVSPDDLGVQNRLAYLQRRMEKKNRADNFQMLEKMIKLCQGNNIIPVIIVMPVTPSFIKYMDQNTYQNLISTLETLSAKYKLPYFNYLTDKSNALLYFQDTDHLNKEGAAFFSQRINREILGNKR